MGSLRRLTAVLVCAALPASAQVEVRAVLAPPSAPRVLAAPAAGLSLAAPALPAAALAPALPLLPAAAAPAAAPAPVPAAPPAAVLRGALAEFSRADLKSAPSSAARAAGEDLMLRAMGGSVAEAPSVPAAAAESSRGALSALAPAAPPAPRRTFLLSRPLREKASLGPAALAAHLAYAVAWEGLKAWLGWKATGSPMGALAVLAVELPFSPAMATGRSLLDLGVRYWRRKLAVLREISRAPGVERVRVLTAGETKFWGPFARSQENTGLIFVDAAGDLPGAVGRFGAPLEIGDASGRLVRLSLSRGGREGLASWTPTLQDLLDGKPMPAEVAASWREALAEDARRKVPLERALTLPNDKELSVEAFLPDANGAETPLGAIARGAAARTLIGLGRADRLRSWLGFQRRPRAIALSDSAVERPGAARETGAAARLRRAWRRLSGRLIVAAPAE